MEKKLQTMSKPCCSMQALDPKAAVDVQKSKCQHRGEDVS